MQNRIVYDWADYDALMAETPPYRGHVEDAEASIDYTPRSLGYDAGRADEVTETLRFALTLAEQQCDRSASTLRRCEEEFRDGRTFGVDDRHARMAERHLSMARFEHEWDTRIFGLLRATVESARSGTVQLSEPAPGRTAA